MFSSPSSPETSTIFATALPCPGRTMNTRVPIRPARAWAATRTRIPLESMNSRSRRSTTTSWPASTLSLTSSSRSGAVARSSSPRSVRYARPSRSAAEMENSSGGVAMAASYSPDRRLDPTKATVAAGRRGRLARRGAATAPTGGGGADAAPAGEAAGGLVVLAVAGGPGQAAEVVQEVVEILGRRVGQLRDVLLHLLGREIHGRSSFGVGMFP